MKQIIQSYKTGIIELSDVPVPLCKSGGVLVRNVNSLISIGTEKLMIDIAKKSLLGKAKARPDLVKRCLDKAKKEGILNVYKEAMNRLDEPVALGYSSAGIIEEVGSNVSVFKKGDRVACVGAGFASHAEFIWVPENLCVRIPETVSFEDASFLMLGGIALQGVRLAELTFGETVVVTGLGLLGLITVQMLEAYGCRVIGIDIDEKKAKAAKQMGACAVLIAGKDDVQSMIENLTDGYGADAVIITAASSTNAPLIQAENIVRRKGKIILVGVADIHLTRKTFWEKEIIFSVSKAAGPGSIEPIYELKNYDYPIEYVRWTEKRNLEHFIDLMARKKVDVKSLITHRFKIEEALGAYKMITEGKERCVGVLLEYPQGEKNAEIARTRIDLAARGSGLSAHAGKVGVIGGGMFTKNILMPALKKVKNISLKAAATTQGVTSAHIGKRFGFEYCTSNYKELLKDPQIDTIMITTRHNLHGKMVVEALKAGKHVYVEKPLCMNRGELEEIIKVFNEDKSKSQKLMVGFNRRYSSIAREVKQSLEKRKTPLVMLYRVNAGYIPPEHWTQDPASGGGRIIGEVCHFIDLFQFFCEAEPVKVYSDSISGGIGKYLNSDNVSLQIKFSDGSIGTIIYTAKGSKSFSRERIELFADDSVALIDDFRTAVITQQGQQKKIKRMSQDMGYFEELDYFFNSNEFDSEKLFKEGTANALATFKAVESLENNIPVDIV